MLVPTRLIAPTRILTCQFHSSPAAYKLFGKKKSETLKKPEEVKAQDPEKPKVPRAKSVFELPEFKVTPEILAKQQQQQEKPNPALYTTHPIIKRVPKFFRPYVGGFINAPYSHVISFMILHEITAIVPLFIIWWAFHQQPDYIPEVIPEWAISRATAIIENWLGNYVTINNFSDKVQFILEGAYAYTIVKVTLPLRLFASFALMPFGARLIVPIFNRFRIKKIDMYKTPQVKLVEMQVDPKAKVKNVKGKKL
ncbi:uncharacterized protein SPAPADRAFT_60471 [Spathaspora passalidarum NRRL Y-27907]|uniref:Uncharacterized protein n=1 Tax=Spathaspora passalidarum (strain NRRL Y-27907 / 11-Y1) TaxID=619300 RepID=G3ALB8_SPAPN|nr:uncharacterized protein SPAPADRAFT_60471 [Spathaspora passalidarum NRRL Y-27907]EGW33161.1 hypothetical protein SPAPADRAFT_60471 [Spathaspora passalidarum NRRL Y-27907]